MDFVLDELILVMFIIFVVSFVSAIINLLFQMKKIISQHNAFYPKFAKENSCFNYMGDVNIKSDSDDILKEKYNHFIER